MKIPLSARACCVVLAMSTLLFSGCSQKVSAPDATSTQPVVSAPTPVQPVKATSIAWEPTLVSALNRARATHKPVMVDFFATWCGPCKHLDANIYSAPSVIQEAQKFISVKIDVDQNAATAQQYQIGPIPTILFLDENGKQIDRYEGAPAQPETFLEWMQSAHSKSLGTAT